MGNTKLGFGLMRLPQSGGEIDVRELCAMTDEFLAGGGSYFDTAYMYHDFKSETAIRTALTQRHTRGEYRLTTKLPLVFVKSAEDCERIFTEQLVKCGVEYFDNYLLHNLGASRYDPIAGRFGCFEFLQKLKERGLAVRTGFSFHDSAELLDRILTEHPEVDLVQLQLNYLDWDNRTIQSRLCLEVARRHGKQVIVMEPLKGGTLASLPDAAKDLLAAAAPQYSPATMALRFAASQPGVETVLSGMSSLAQLRENIACELSPLSPAETEAVFAAAKLINAATAVPCTGCGYCAAGCPQNIAIPEYFALLNAEQRALNKGFSTQRTYYNNLLHAHGRASACIGCASCEDVCPQHLPIREKLKEVAKAFE